MTKREVIVQVAGETGLNQLEVQDVIQRALDRITEALCEGDTVEFRKFGVFEVQERKARIGRNPKRPEQTVTIPRRRVVKFKPGLVMRQRITGRK